LHYRNRANETIGKYRRCARPLGSGLTQEGNNLLKEDFTKAGTTT